MQAVQARAGLRSTRAAAGAGAPRRTAARAVATPPNKTEWTPQSWRNYTALQQPKYPSQEAVLDVEERLSKKPPLVFAGECRSLTDALGKVALGQGFLLQGGDCAESFSQFETDNVRDTFRVILQMALVLQYNSGLPTVKIGRIAGQFAKPRSSDMEKVGDLEIPSYRGDIINGPAKDEASRVPDPERLVDAYDQSANTLNLLRAFSTGGYADLGRIHNWNLDFVANSPEGSKFYSLCERVSESISFMRACGVDTAAAPFDQTAFYTSHEALLLPYESALTRQDSTTGLWYCTSAHFLWLGERTRQLDGAHLEFLRGVNNPLGCKISDKATVEDVFALCDALNPDNVPGRLTLISRMGADKLRTVYAGIVRAVADSGRHVVWQCDPMHGNTVTSSTGFKTRKFEAIRAELRAFFDVHEAEGTHAGGVHLEMTGQDVTECTGGAVNILDEDLSKRYHTHCDPRLNANQALELSFLVAEGMRRRAGKSPLFTTPGSSGVPARGDLED